MAAHNQRQLRPRKRKRLDDNPNSEQDVKRRKKGEIIKEKWSEKSAKGFCQECTNPYKLISCRNCFRSWHINCFNKSLLNNTKIEPIPTNSNQEEKELSPSIPSIPSSIINDSIKFNTCHSKISQSIIYLQEIKDKNGNEIKFKCPKIVTISPSKTIEDDINQIAKKQKRIYVSERRPEPIEIKSMPLKLSQQSTNEYNNEIIKWFKNVTPLIQERSSLYSDQQTKQIIATFECNDCVNNTHICFICKQREKQAKDDMNMNIMEIPINCNQKNCGLFYHISCLKDDPKYCQHTTFLANGNIKCPIHHCWTCHERDVKQKLIGSSKRRNCWYCPRSYHRCCVPPKAELLSINIVDSVDEIFKKYPPFRYDLITCCWNDADKDSSKQLKPYHPYPKDLQFGRDDVKAGIFKWKLWDGTIAEFYRLDDDPFSIDISLIHEFNKNNEKKKINKFKNKQINPFPANFKRINRCRYPKGYKRPPPKPDYGRCFCVDGCKLDWSCQNWGMELECNDQNCGSRDPSLCQNRQWRRANFAENVVIKPTENTGFGAFAAKDFKAYHLIMEYVGEMIDKQEMTKRIRELNEKKAMNFYFFQMDSMSVIDGTNYGNESRFLNHSCDPNCHTVKWIVDGIERLGIYANVDIKAGTELTYDYQFEVENTDDVNKLCKCLCGAKNCRFFLGFNKRKAKEYKEMLIANGEWIEPEIDEYHKKRSKKKKKKKKSKKKKKKKKKKKNKKKDKDKENIEDEDVVMKDNEEQISQPIVSKEMNTKRKTEMKVLKVSSKAMNTNMKVIKVSKTMKANRVMIDEEAFKENIKSH